MEEACSAHREDDKCIQVLVRKPEGKKQVGRPRHRNADYSKSRIREVEQKGVN
jgi:hypothetical protein